MMMMITYRSIVLIVFAIISSCCFHHVSAFAPTVSSPPLLGIGAVFFRPKGMQTRPSRGDETVLVEAAHFFTDAFWCVLNKSCVCVCVCREREENPLSTYQPVLLVSFLLFVGGCCCCCLLVVVVVVGWGKVFQGGWWYGTVVGSATQIVKQFPNHGVSTAVRVAHGPPTGPTERVVGVAQRSWRNHGRVGH